MKAKTNPRNEKTNSEVTLAGTIPLARAKEIVSEEGMAYTEEELKEVLQFVSKVVSITTSYNERTKQKQATLININTDTTHETKSLSLYPSQYRRAS